MPTTIRLARGGTRNRPYFRIVVANSRKPRDGDYIERIGSYDPLLKNEDPKRVEIDAERVKYWLSVGAQPSNRVHRFLHKAGLIATAPHMRPTRKPRKEQPEDAAAPAAAAPEAPAAEAAAS